MYKKFTIGAFLLFMPCFANKPVVSGNRIPSIPYITGDGFRAMANHVFDETDTALFPDEVQLGDIVFVKGDKQGDFFNKIHPKIQHQYILVVHNSDADCPGDFAKYLEDEKIAKWFGQNPTVMHYEKFVPIPIGVANRYVGDHGNCDHYKDFWLKDTRKQYLLGYNFEPGSNRTERGPVWDRFARCDYAHNLLVRPHIRYLTKMSQAEFILSPRGNGLDCHRTWEALIVGAVPIVHTSMLDELLEDLPVIIVNDWSEVNKTLLQQQYDQLRPLFAPSGLQKVTYAYWNDQLLACQQEVRKNK